MSGVEVRPRTAIQEKGRRSSPPQQVGSMLSLESLDMMSLKSTLTSTTRKEKFYLNSKLPADLSPDDKRLF